MASAGAFPSDGGVLFAIQTLHSFLPLIVAPYYAISYIVSIVWMSGHDERRQHRSSIQTIVLWLMLTVLVTYGLDSAILIYGSFSNSRVIIRQDHIIFALGSVLLWFTLILGFVDSASPAWYPFYGSWVAYLVTEAILLGLSPGIEGHSGQFRVLTGLQILRLCILFLLLCSVAGSRTRRPEKTQVDEENAPLLAHESARSNNPESPEQRGSSDGYGTITRVQTESQSSGQEIKLGEDKRSEKKQSNHLENFMFLLPFFWPKEKPHLQLVYIGVGLCLLLDRALNVLVPLQLGLITNILSEGSGKLPWKEITLFVTLQLLDSSGGISAVRRYLWLPLENYSYHKISTAAFDQIMSLSSDFHDNKHSGGLWQSVSRGTSVRHIVDSILFQIGPMLVDLVLAVSVLYYLFDAYMALIIAAVTVFYLWSSSKILSKQKDKRRQWISTVEKEYNILCESTSNWQTVSYFNRQPHEKSRYSSAVKDHMSSSLIFMLWSQFESVAQSFLVISGLTGACFLAAYQVIQGNKPVGSFVMLLSYWSQLSGPLRFFAHGFCDITLDMVNAEELIDLLKQKPTVCDRRDAKALVLNQGEIQFDGVEFSYDGRRKILKDISFHVRPGQTVALVGETGGGKSTILKLISRFYDPRSGTVTIDGQNICEVTLDSLRASIGVVPQDPALFHDSIINNIRYANPSATDEEIYEACKSVALHDKFLAFADGYQTVVGERGVKLSGGELQRVAIARAIVRNPKIVLLDEATSSVDSNTELRIQESLKKLTTRRTTLVIAHRLSTVVNADRILVIEDGNIIEQGSHEELLKVNGHYHRLWSLQSSLGSSSEKDQRSESQRATALVDVEDLQSRPAKDHIDGDEASSLNTLPTEEDRAGLQAEVPDVSVSVQGGGIMNNNLAHNVFAENASEAVKDSSKKTSLKPDAPEFIPERFRRSEPLTSQTVAEHNAVVGSVKHRGRSYQAGKENFRGKSACASGRDYQRYTNAQVLQASHTASKEDGTEGFGPAAGGQVGGVQGLQDTGPMTMTAAHSTASTNKAHKQKKKRVFRRRLSKSEPPSQG